MSSTVVKESVSKKDYFGDHALTPIPEEKRQNKNGRPPRWVKGGPI